MDKITLDLLFTRYTQASHEVKIRSNVVKSSLILGSAERSSAILRHAWITVVWSRPPKASPISGKLWLVNSLDQAIAICRGLAIDRLRLFDNKSATRIL